ncbi:hypothetical protein [Rhodoblastus sp.]|uniref:hypothetical protein n=1 Tax=Rhodoblastus sp. TaxID=1962975 RepID=UPI0026031A2E|nr:hypothetical protein [Rhodoblastus sp.]
MKLALIALGLALLSGCAGYDSNGYYQKHIGIDARLTVVCQTGEHRITLTATAQDCRRRGGTPI